MSLHVMKARKGTGCSYNALRRVDGRIEEVKVVVTDTGRRERHVRWHDDPETARASVRRANGVGVAS